MLFNLALVFWLIIDPIGSVPIFASNLKQFPSKKQRYIIIREMLIALAIMVAVLFFGREFFQLIEVDETALSITGGIILLLIAVKMIFAKIHKDEATTTLKEPIIVPLAMPITAGPAVLVAILLYSSGGLADKFLVLGAICIAWGLALPILLLSPEIKKYIGPNGAVAVERLFGFILVLISMQMLLSGIMQALKVD